VPKKATEPLPAVWESIRQHIEAALEAVELREIGEDRLPTAMFVFVREMMRFPWNDTCREDPDYVADIMERAWTHFRNGESFWDAWEQYDEEFQTDFRGAFIRVWLQMRCPPGADPLLTAKASADQAPMSLRFKARMQDNPDYRRLLSICYHLQRLMGSKPVALPQDRLAQIVGKSQQTISGYLAVAERSGIIKKVSRHDFNANLAAKFQVATELFTPSSD